MKKCNAYIVFVNTYNFPLELMVIMIICRKCTKTTVIRRLMKAMEVTVVECSKCIFRRMGSWIRFPGGQES